MRLGSDRLSCQTCSCSCFCPDSVAKDNQQKAFLRNKGTPHAVPVVFARPPLPVTPLVGETVPWRQRPCPKDTLPSAASVCRETDRGGGVRVRQRDGPAQGKHTREWTHSWCVK